jgi:iron-sulfur cluster assembly accessory protein
MITLSPRALSELKDLMESQEKATAALRVWVAGGGCSGLQYGMALDEETPDSDGDEVYEQEGVKIFIDKMSLNYMDGSSVDFIDDDMGGGFKIENPKAVGGCGCGNSFQTEEGEYVPGGGGGCGSCGSRK